MSTKMLRLMLVCGVLFGQVVARDLPVFYRAPLLDGQPSNDVGDWHTTLSISYLQGGTDHSWNGGSHKSELLDTWGILDVTKLGMGVQDKVAPLTTYWNDAGTGTFDDPDDFTGNDGKVSISGHHETKEFSLELRQNVLLGFYLYAYAPIRSVKNGNITPKYLGENGDVQAFLGANFDGDFATILTEYGYKPINSSYSKTEFSDSLVGLGWQGFDSTSFEVIDSLSGGGEIGVVIPAGAKRNDRFASALPTGYNNHWAVKAQVEGEVGFWKYFALGASTSATMFFRSERTMRMKTSKLQTGVLALDKGYAREDLGSMWGGSGYLKATGGAFSGFVGASFTRWEKTDLDVREDHFLKRVVDAANQGTGEFVSRDDIVNDDDRLQAGDVYTVHVKACYDMRKKMTSVFAPALSFQYSCPVAGSRIFINDVFAGTLDANLQWNF